jgi:hypothetical protein
MESVKTAPAPKGVASTKETWSMAIKYVAARKQIEEALGFILEANRALREHTAADELVAAYAKMAVPYLADVACFDFFPIGRDEVIRASTANGISQASVNRLRAIGASKVSDSLAKDGELINEVALLPEVTNPRIKDRGAFIRVPIERNGKVYGSLTLIKCCDDVPKFSPAILSMARELARHTGMALGLSGA